MDISWTGGQTPFSILVAPTSSNPINYEIPDSAFSNSIGSFSFQLTLNASSSFVLAMSDGRGIGTGGNSDVLIVGSSSSGSPCDTSEKPADFTFDIDSNLQQCRSYSIEHYDGATQPVTIIGLIPLGKAFTLQPPVGSTSFQSVANIPAGTDVIFLLRDSQGRSGGSADIRAIAGTDDSSCINAQSPSSTLSKSATAIPPGSTTGLGDSSPGGVVPSGKSHKGSVIGGVVAGVVLFFLALTAFMYFCMRRQRDRSSVSSAKLEKRSSKRTSSRGYSADLIPDRSPNGLLAAPRPSRSRSSTTQPTTSSPLSRTPEEIDYEYDPFELPYSSSHSSHEQHTPNAGSFTPSDFTPTAYSGSSYLGSGTFGAVTTGHNTSNSPAVSHESGTPSSGDRGGGTGGIGGDEGQHQRQSSSAKAAEAGASPTESRPATRFVLHTDADDPSEDEAAEPPQYTDGRPELRHASSSRRNLRPPLPPSTVSYDKPPPSPGPFEQ